jgi:4-hydroxybenzoate polyprenyltransferase
MATPAFGALLWLGAFPSPKVIFLGLITALAGYTAVYALNDVVDYPVDKEKIRQGGLRYSGNDLDAKIIRHPMAHDLVSFREGLAWTMAWALLALIGAYHLNPVCVLIFMIGCGLEIVYCLLLKRSHLRAVVSGAVKTSGAIAAVFAVDTAPSATFLIVLFMLFFFWEIGGQNIPNDWPDMEEDLPLRAKTIPIRFGTGTASIFILSFLMASLAMNAVIFWLSPVRFKYPSIAAGLFIGFCLLVVPGYRLYRTKDRRHALALFNRASFYPVALLALVTFNILI